MYVYIYIYIYREREKALMNGWREGEEWGSYT